MKRLFAKADSHGHNQISGVGTNCQLFMVYELNCVIMSFRVIDITSSPCHAMVAE